MKIGGPSPIPRVPPTRTPQGESLGFPEDRICLDGSEPLPVPARPVVEPPALQAPTLPTSEVVNQTLGWSGEPCQTAPLRETHRAQIHAGLALMEQVLPGTQDRLDELLHRPDTALQDRLKALAEEQIQLFGRHARVLSLPEEQLGAKEKTLRDQLTVRLDRIAHDYEEVERKIHKGDKFRRQQAEQLAEAFLSRLRKQGPGRDVSERVKVDPSARARLAQDGIEIATLHQWVNEFHHQTGLPTPGQLRFRYSESRPNYTHQVDSINIGDRFSKRLALHEIAHRAEYRFPEISQANKSWVQARCRQGGFGEEPVPLRQLVPGDRYGADEEAFEDTFVNPYVGKRYADTATEVLSMGLEHFANGSLFTRLYQGDPEHLFLTLGAISILHSKKAW